LTPTLILSLTLPLMLTLALTTAAVPDAAR